MCSIKHNTRQFLEICNRDSILFTDITNDIIKHFKLVIYNIKEKINKILKTEDNNKKIEQLKIMYIKIFHIINDLCKFTPYTNYVTKKCVIEEINDIFKIIVHIKIYIHNILCINDVLLEPTDRHILNNIFMLLCYTYPTFKRHGIVNRYTIMNKFKRFFQKKTLTVFLLEEMIYNTDSVIIRRNDI